MREHEHPKKHSRQEDAAALDVLEPPPGPPAPAPDLTTVLTTGNDAGGLSIINLSSITVGDPTTTVAQINLTGSRCRITSQYPIEFAAENAVRIYIDGDGLHGDGNPFMNVGDPGNDSDAATKHYVDNSNAAQGGITADVVPAAQTLHFVDGLLTSIS